MADPVNYPRGPISAQATADQMLKYAAQIAEAQRRVQAGAVQTTDLLRQQGVATQEVGQLTSGTTGITEANMAARTANTAAINAETAALERQLVVARSMAGAQTGRIGAGPTMVGGSSAVAATDAETAALQRQVVAAREAEAAVAQASRGGALALGPGRSIMVPPTGPMSMREQLGMAGAPPGGRPPMPPAPPGGAPPPSEPPAGGAAGVGVLGQQVSNSERLAQNEANLIRLRTQAGSQMANLSTAMRRNGALTSEFFEALGRGEVTTRELGYQMGITLAKFGGWTAAAGLIYGVVGALREVATGAMQAQAGVATLSRFVPDINRDQAQTGFIDVSRQLVEPIQSVAEAQAAFAKVTHDQSGSLMAARTAILATKLDNVNLADSYRYLVSIMQELQIPASRIPAIFDQISGAQRNVGARVAELLPALGKATGAIRTAGGDFNQLIAEMSLAIVTTGQTGQLVGTGFARGAANFYNSTSTLRGVGRTPIDIEQSLGIDTSLGFTQRLHQAIVKAATMTDHERLLLAESFFGPQRGALLAGIFRQGPQMAKFLEETSPQKTAGSAMEEWGKQAGRADVQLARLKIGLQDLGAEAAKSGALRPFGWLLYGANTGINAISTITRGFGGMSSEMRTVTEAGFALLAVMKGLSSFAGGQMLANTPILSFFDNPQARAGRLLSSGMSEATTGAQTAAIAAAQAQTRAVNVAAISGASAKEAEARKVALKAQAAAQEEIALAETQATEATNIAAADTEAAATAAQRAAAAQLSYQAAAAEQAAVAQMTPAQQAAYSERRGGLLIPAGFQRPSTSPLIEMREYGMAAQAAEIESVTGGSAISAREVGLYTKAKAGLSQQLALETAMLQGASVAQAEEIVAARSAASAELALAEEVPLTTAAMNSLRTGGQFLIANLGKLLGAFVVGLLVFEGIKSNTDKLNQETADFNQGLEQGFASWDNFQANLKEQRKRVADRQRRESAGVLSDIPVLGDVAAFVGGLSGHKGPAYKGSMSQSQSLLNVADVQGEFQNFTRIAAIDGERLIKTEAGRRQWYRELGNFNLTAKQTAAADPAAAGVYQTYLAVIGQIYARIQAEAGITHVRRAAPFAQFRTVSLQQNVKNLQALGDQMKLFGPTQESLQEMATALMYITTTVSRSSKPADIQAAMQAMGYFTDAVTADVQDKIQQAEAITIPSIKAAGVAAHAAALRQRSALMSAASRELHKDERTLTGAYQILVRANEDAVAALANAVRNLDIVRGEVAVVNAVVAPINSLMGGLGKSLGIAIPQINVPKNAQDVIQGAKNKVAETKQKMDQGKRVQDQADARLQQLLNQIANDRQNYANQLASGASTGNQDALEIARLQSQIASAQAEGDPIRQAQLAEGLAHTEMSLATNEKDRLQAQLDLIQAENTYNQAVQDRAQARFDLLKSQTTDPFKQAVIDLHAAQAQLAYDIQHGGADTATSLRDRAKVNQAVQKVREQHVTDAEDTIDFRLKMNQISTETAIREYEGLLHVHGLTKQLRRQVLEKIQELKNSAQSDFGALDLGTIRLPTPYEIRRSIMQLRDQGAASVFQQNTANIHVYDTNSAATVGVQMDRFIGGTGKALARAAGTR